MCICVICVRLDGQINKDTLTYQETDSHEEKSVIRKCVETEHHLTFTYEDLNSPGTYLTHRTIPIIGVAGNVLVQQTLIVLQEYNCLGSIQALLLDNTAVQ